MSAKIRSRANALVGRAGELLAAKTGSGLARCGKGCAESREGTPPSVWKKGKVVARSPMRNEQCGNTAVDLQE
jgi:hypothetical protein